MTKKAKIISICILLLLLLTYIIISNYKSNIEKETHIDNRDLICNGKTITSVEYNIDTKECFKTEISACQEATFSSINECKKLNGLKVEENEIEKNDKKNNTNNEIKNNSNETIEKSETSNNTGIIEKENIEDNQQDNESNIVENESNNTGPLEENIENDENNNSGTIKEEKDSSDSLRKFFEK